MTSICSPLAGRTWSDLFNFFFFFFINLFIYFWLCWVFVSVRGLSLVAASGGLSLSRPLPLRGTGSRRAGSVVVAQGLSCSAACGIFPDQGSNPCPLHWQADSQPLRHQGSPWPIQLYLLLFLNHQLGRSPVLWVIFALFLRFYPSSLSSTSTSPVNLNSTIYFAMSIVILSCGLHHLPTGLLQLPPDWSFFFQFHLLLQFILPITAAYLLKTLQISTLPLEQNLSSYHVYQAMIALALSSPIFSY